MSKQEKRKRRRRRRKNPKKKLHMNNNIGFQFNTTQSESVDEADDIQTTSKSFTQWSVGTDGTYYPTFSTVRGIPSGFYELGNSNQGPFFKHKSVSCDELYSLPSPELVDVIKDIETFWERGDKYREYNFVHKRGILLYGRPGTGKSAIIQLLAKHLIEEKGGVVINISSIEDLGIYNSIISGFRQIEPNRPLIVIMEDIDGLMREGSWAVSMVLNLLDGIKQIDNVVYIATTNYPERLEERIINRPSRFDRRYEVKVPTDEVRREYLTKKLKPSDLKNIDLDEWVQRSKGFTLSHMRELVVSVATMGNTFEETVERLNNLKNKVKSDSGMGKVGFQS